jgi:hypothetical protein
VHAEVGTQHTHFSWEPFISEHAIFRGSWALQSVTMQHLGAFGYVATWNFNEVYFIREKLIQTCV